MAVLKCKMCGGELVLSEDSVICECEYCGSKQTVPIIDNEKKKKLYDRANKLRFNCDFDKASTVYENIANEYPDDAESYWGLVLCRYGIEYVEDPATGKKVPTCHRSSFDSVMDDPDFEMVMENAEDDARALYRSEAKQIEEIRKGILEVSGHEDPYDIFICYKETDKDGERTLDSVLAQDVYQLLAEKGYRVFFSRISLEDKLGTEYEPYIFAALNSAKVMLVFGTSYDNYNAVWVKNEWSRFIKLMASDRTKYLIPCFKDIDAYDIPKEFAKYQAQDLGKIGAVQDLIRGIEKIFGKDVTLQKSQNNANQVADAGLAALTTQNMSLLKRGHMALDDEEYDRATTFFEMVLNNDAECAQAYWGKVLAGKKVRNTDALIQYILDRIHQEKITEPEFLNRRNLSEIAREADKSFGLLANIPDSELNELLEDLKKPEVYDSGFVYYKGLSESIDENTIGSILDDRNFDRALLYADSQVQTEKEYIIHFIKNELNKTAEKEQQITHQEKQKAQQDNVDISSEIQKRLNIAAESIAIEKEKAEKTISSKSKTYQEELLTREKEYNQKLQAWELKKKEYDANLYQANAGRAEYQREIFRMKQELKGLSGFQNIKKRKEIENYIEVLERKKNEILLPKDPGQKPQMNMLSRKDFEQDNVINNLSNEDSLIITKCTLSSRFKTQYEEECNRQVAFIKATDLVQKATQLANKFKSEEAVQFYNNAINIFKTLPMNYHGADNYITQCENEIEKIKKKLVVVTVKDGMIKCPKCRSSQSADRTSCWYCNATFIKQ